MEDEREETRLDQCSLLLSFQLYKSCESNDKSSQVTNRTPPQSRILYFPVTHLKLLLGAPKGINTSPSSPPPIPHAPASLWSPSTTGSPAQTNTLQVQIAPSGPPTFLPVTARKSRSSPMANGWIRKKRTYLREEGDRQVSESSRERTNTERVRMDSR